MIYEALYKIFFKNNDRHQEIYLQRFHHEFTYQYDFFIGENQAFLVMNLEILKLVSSILHLDKELQRNISLLPKIALIQFTKKCIVDEIKLSNDIEGVSSTRKEIKEVISDWKNQNKGKRLYGLVNKYMLLTDEKKIALETCRDIRALYDEFISLEIKSDDSNNLPDGEFFRKDIVEIVSSNQKVIHQGVYPETKIISEMTAALKELNDGDMEYIVKIAVFHYMFGYIHPFYDGNGRMARFISSYLLAQPLEPLNAFGLSAAIKGKIKKYYDMFKETNDPRNKGDLTPFVIGFLEFVEESIHHLCATLIAKCEELDFYIKQIKHFADKDEALGDLLFVLLQNSLFADEGIRIEELSAILEISSSTVRMQLKKIPANMLIVTRDGRLKLYDLNLDCIAEINYHKN